MDAIKKLLRLIIICMLLFTINGCSDDSSEQIVGPQGPQGPEGPPGPSGSVNATTYNYFPNQNQWVLQNGYWRTIAPVPITQQIINTGIVHVYWSMNGIQTPMPFSADGVDYIASASADMIENGGIFINISQTGMFQSLNPSWFGIVQIKTIVIPN